MDTALTLTSHHEADGRTVLTLRGEVDLVTAPRLRTAVMAHLPRCAALVLDVTGAVLIDAAGLRVLTAAGREALRLGKPPITLRGVRPLLAKSLTITGIDHLFTREPAPAPTMRRTSARSTHTAIRQRAVAATAA